MLECIYRPHNEGFKVTTWSSLSWIWYHSLYRDVINHMLKIFSVCCNGQKQIVLVFSVLLFVKRFCFITCVLIRNMAETLSARIQLRNDYILG